MFNHQSQNNETNRAEALMNMVRKVNPQMADTPFAVNAIQALVSNDISKCQQLAQNYCSSNNVSTEEMLQAANKFFGR